RAPELLGTPVDHVRAQHIAAFAPAGPVVPLRASAPVQSHAGGMRRVGDEVDHIAAGGALIPFEQAPELALQAAYIERPARPPQALPEPRQSVLDPARKPLVHRALLLTALHGADQHKRLDAVGTDALLGFDPVAHRLPVPRLGAGPRPFFEFALGRPHEIASARLAQPFQIVFACHAAIHDPDPVGESVACFYSLQDL